MPVTPKHCISLDLTYDVLYRLGMPNTVQSSPVDIPDLFEAHAKRVLATSPTSTLYAERVLRRTGEVRELFRTKEGGVYDVVSTWRDDFRPIAGAVFGIEISPLEVDHLPQSHSDFRPTVVDGVSGRVRRISLDEIMGPLLTLDLVATE